MHHGNGTEAPFYDSDAVLFVSLHQDGLYPLDTGGVERVGEGAGRGYNINVPLPPGSGWGAYHAAVTRIVVPALRLFKPDLVLLSAGFDASFLDPLGRQMLTAAHFGAMTAAVVAAADEVCGGRVVAAHEGGYSEIYVPFAGVETVAALAGVRSGVDDPFEKDVGSERWQALQPHQEAAVAAAEAVLDIALRARRGGGGGGE